MLMWGFFRWGLPALGLGVPATFGMKDGLKKRESARR